MRKEIQHLTNFKGGRDPPAAANTSLAEDKAAVPDGIPGRMLRDCSHQFAGVLTDIFNLS